VKISRPEIEKRPGSQCDDMLIKSQRQNKHPCLPYRLWWQKK
jgi:hypothetical protein